MRLALVTPDGLRILVQGLVHDGRGYRCVERAGTLLFQTGDRSLGMAIISALTWEGELEPFEGPFAGVVVEFVDGAYRAYHAEDGRTGISIPGDAWDGQLGREVARLMGWVWEANPYEPAGPSSRPFR